MRFTRLHLKNWKNFKEVDVALTERVFIVGPNAGGKSNLLDAFRFLHDLAATGGGLEPAVNRVRGGMKAVRSIHAKSPALVRLAVEVLDESSQAWSYEIEFDVDKSAGPIAPPRVVRERVTRAGVEVLVRPDSADSTDELRLRQTSLEQISANRDFRPIAEFFRSIEYMNLIPQLLREGQSSPGLAPGVDALGRDFLQRVAAVKDGERKKRLRAIGKIVSKAVPNLTDLEFHQDARTGRPHLRVKFKHWRARGAKQLENQLSDGTLRLIAMLWQLFDDSGPLLLDEPEWSLHTNILRKLASFMARIQALGKGRQLIAATHSESFLSDVGIGPEEVLVIAPTAEGSSVRSGIDFTRIKLLVEQGRSIGEASLSLTGSQPLLFTGALNK
jgi:predicted ATPase